MKFVQVIILIALLSTVGYTQAIPFEKNFESNRKDLSLVRFSVGEDATSGFDYFVYKGESHIEKIRSIWSGCCEAPRVEDFYFKDGKPVLYVKLSAKKNQLSSLRKGRIVKLNSDEKFYLADSKLTMWIENGKMISSQDSRWQDKEKFVLEQANDALETYRMHQNGEL